MNLEQSFVEAVQDAARRASRCTRGTPAILYSLAVASAKSRAAIRAVAGSNRSPRNLSKPPASASDESIYVLLPARSFNWWMESRPAVWWK